MIRIKGFIETSFVDWPGQICSVLFLPGCNFRCPFCHNHRLVLEPGGYEDIPLEFIWERLEGMREWIDGVCITGGEPTIYPELPSFLREFKERGIAVKLDTNGSHPQLLREVIEEGLVDFVAMDIKAPLEELSYRRAAGVPVDLKRIEESIEILLGGRVDYLFRVTVVPPLHDEEAIRKIALRIRGAKALILQGFNPQDPLDPALKEVSPYPEEWLKGLQGEVSSILKN